MCSKPIEAAACKPFFQASILGLAIYMLIECSGAFKKGIIWNITNIRMQPTKLRGGGSPTDAVVNGATKPIVDFGVLLDGCKIEGKVKNFPGGIIQV